MSLNLFLPLCNANEGSTHCEGELEDPQNVYNKVLFLSWCTKNTNHLLILTLLLLP